MHSAEQELYEEFVELVEAEGLELDLHGRGGKGDVEVLKDLGMEHSERSNLLTTVRNAGGTALEER